MCSNKRFHNYHKSILQRVNMQKTPNGRRMYVYTHTWGKRTTLVFGDNLNLLLSSCSSISFRSQCMFSNHGNLGFMGVILNLRLDLVEFFESCSFPLFFGILFGDFSEEGIQNGL